MSDDKMRSEFESWAETELLAVARGGAGNHIYTNGITRNAWLGWQAALEHKPEVSQTLEQEPYDLKSLRVNLKNGEYNGVDIMRAWLVIDRLIKSEAENEALKADNVRLQSECDRLQTVIDSRPAINAGLPQSYIEWSQSIYLMDVLNITETKQ